MKSPLTGLPISQPALTAGRLEVRSCGLAAALREPLRLLGQSEQTPLPAVLLGAAYVLACRYSSQQEVAISCVPADFRSAPINGQSGGEKEVSLRIDVSDDPSFVTLLQRIKVGLMALPQPADSQPGRDGVLPVDGTFPLRFRWRALRGNGNGQAASSADAASALRLEVEEDDLQLHLGYDSYRFDADSAERILSHFHRLLTGIAENPNQKLSALPILSESEKRRILVEWNQTACDYPGKKCLHELIEAQAERRPEQTAIVRGGIELSYGEFNARANQLAHFLQSRGVGPEQRIAICLDPSPEFCIAVLAVLKAGAACVPLDPKYPKDRLAYMLQDVQARLVITQREMLAEGAPAGCEVFVVGENEELLSGQPRSNPRSGATAEDIAYVIYTSGSTGKPRGVLLTHSGLANYNANAARLYSMTAEDRVLQFCSVSFDIAVEELFITWLSAATLVLRTAEMPLAVPEFLDWVERQGITVLDLPTAYWHEWVHEFAQLKRPAPRGLRLVIVGGEKPSSHAYVKWLDLVGRRVRWINTYGPTEISICATAFEPDYSSASEVPENLPIGRPLANARVYLLDRHLNPVPVGVAGELHVAGAGVARGYLNRPELTAEKFIPDFFSAEAEAGARMYKTGDMARYLPGGDIEFLGRKDDQIKIRGFRIELGEIESALAKHPGVREAAVIAREQGSQGNEKPGNAKQDNEKLGNEKQLVAYFVAAQAEKPSAAELRRYLRQQLPDYMVPAIFVGLEAMPLTPNGKINRRGLPAPPSDASSEAQPAMANNGLQALLLKIWEDVLGKKSIGIRDNFFALGGHSILAARLMHRTGKALGKTLPLAMLFHAPTVEELAAVLGQDEWSHHWSSLVPIQPMGSQPPFFCIHGVGGNVVGFHGLGRRMAPDHPFYGLQSQGLDGKQACLTSVEAMASHYIAEMRSVQPRGPYFLGGFSFGGVIGYEIAQQLRAKGEEAALLVLFDTYPGNVNFEAKSLLRMLLKPSRQLWFHEIPRAAEKKLRRTWRNLRVPRALWDVHNANRDAAAQYVLRPYPGNVTLIRATEKPLEGATDPHAAWNSLAENLVVHEMQGDHYDLLQEPQVSHLAASLKSWIDGARKEYEHAPRNFAGVSSASTPSMPETKVADAISAENDGTL